MFEPGTQEAQTGEIPMTELILGEIVWRTGLLTGQFLGRRPGTGVSVGSGDVAAPTVTVFEDVVPG